MNRGHILGDLTTQPHCGLARLYFEERDMWVDCRVPDMLHIHPEANIGWCCNLVVMTHDITPGHFGALSGRPIWIDKGAFVAGFCTLYNCHIGEGAVVAVGSVVRSMDVEPGTMVAGNPARVIAKLEGGKWIHVNADESIRRVIREEIERCLKQQPVP